MTNVELYINNQLCDIRDPQNLGIRLNRVLINPAELATKDAQYSYSINIPSSRVNDAIFNYINVEEVKDKFNHNHTAQVHVDGVMVFDGRFKLSEIDSSGNYKGNLVVPTPKTVKEIFGDTKMNEIAEWEFDLTKDGSLVDMPMGMVEMLNTVNAAKGTPDAIMPLVLYGLLPKRATTSKDGEKSYSAKDVWDDTVQLGIEDFPPSINCLATMKHIFETTKGENGKNYKITGSAFNDPKLTNLYMSYSNPTDYEQPWNWAHLGKMVIKGSWYNATGGRPILDVEYNYYQIDQDNTRCVAVNLFSAKNSNINVIDDAGYNIYQYKTKQKEGYEVKNTSLSIPISGLYKITLDASMELQSYSVIRNAGTSVWHKGNIGGKLRFIHANENMDNNRQEEFWGTKPKNLFYNIRGELKLLRTRGDEIDMTKQGIDGLFFQKNFKQKEDKNGKYYKVDDETQYPMYDTSPKYFPQENSVLWIDPVQNRNFICGLHWGKPHYNIKTERNPVDNRDVPAYVMAAKSGISWDADNDDVNYCVTNSTEYWTYRALKQTVTEDDEPEDDDMGYIKEGKLKMELNDLPQKNKIETTYTDNDLSQKGDGFVSVVVWLDKGDQLALVDVVDKGTWKGNYMDTYVRHESKFTLTIEPYKKSQDWARINMDGTGAASMVWSEDSDFSENHIDLSKFLPSEQKVDEWIENFCKAFNLDLLQPEADKFQLNTKKRSYITAAGSVLDLSEKVDLRNRINQPLGLPSEISATFKINKEEEGYAGYIRNNKNDYEPTPDDGSGKLLTGSLDGKVLAQPNSFSYCWYKDINCGYFFDKKELFIPFPVISNKEAWEQPNDRKDYLEMQKKTYTNYPQRFWYRGTTSYNMGALWKDRYTENSGWSSDKNEILHIYPVIGNSNDKTGIDYLALTYKDQPNSILRTYFTLISTDDSNYTEIECFLTPDEYDRLSVGTLVSLNSDLYYVASIDGYDPVGRNKTKLKLIRKV